MAGEAITGAVSGAAAGSAAGPWGAVIGGGLGLAGGILGARSARSSARSQREIAEAMRRAQALQEEIIRKYEGIAEPFRQTLYPQLLSILRGETDMSETPFYASSRVPLEEQYSVARRNIEARGGGTGAIGRSLAKLESTRASEVGGIPSRLYQSLFGSGLGIASGKPELAVQGYGDIARTGGPLLETYQQGINAGNQLAGEGGGMLGDSLYNLLTRQSQPQSSQSSQPYYGWRF